MAEAATPTIEHDYQHIFFDSARWRDFAFRPDDILVCTSYKAGTTWTQMICALLVHQTTDMPASMSVMSPWLDMRVAAKADIFAALEAQPHRRIVKTHTPLDGLPYRKDVQYVFCGRDPRDVFMSLQNHLANADIDQVTRLLEAQGIELNRPPPLPDDLNERFALWMTKGLFDWEEDGLPYWSHFRHAQTFWAYRHLPNIHFLHFSDLKADLEGEMRRLAGTLGVAVPEDLWPTLVKAATFEDMRANADRTAPDVNHKIWRSNAQFFNKGENGQWVGALSDASLRLYEETARARYADDLLDWLEQGSLEAGRP